MDRVKITEIMSNLLNSFQAKNTNNRSKLFNSFAFVLLALFLLPVLTACGPKAPCPTTPVEAAIEQAERQRMVSNALYETSPRYNNNLPKAVSEFCTRLPTRRCPPSAPVTAPAVIVEE